MKHALIAIVLLMTSMLARAGEDVGVEVSLLTCEPGAEIYEHYGHTALRVRCGGDSLTRPFDVVFNYGCFDFNTPNFAMRFALGQTDYVLAYYSFALFCQEYNRANRRVWEQRLNLTREEAETMAQALFVESRPENRTYRYNFLYNNCTTRCRDIIEQTVHGEVHWPEDYRRLTLRDIMHQYNRRHSWASMGIDLLLGGSIDRESTPRERMFAPMYMMDYLNRATVSRADGTQPLASPAVAVVNPAHPYASRDTDGEAFAVILMTLMAVALAAASCLINGRFGILRVMCGAVLFIIGVLGIIPAFLFFFSEHPAVGTNLLVLALNPLPLVLLLVRHKLYAFYTNLFCLLMAVFTYFAGTLYSWRCSIGHRQIVLLQYVPGSIKMIVALYIAALIGYLFLCIDKTLFTDKRP